MSSVRVIARLDIKGPNLIKGVRFEGVRVLGDPRVFAKKYYEEGHFQAGSMGPKFQAALYFLKHHGEKVIITSIDGVKKAINGEYGTIISNN